MNNFSPFVRSDLGLLEYHLCKTFHKLPHEIGEARRRNPDEIRFLELAMIEEWKREKKHMDEMKKKQRIRGLKRH